MENADRRRQIEHLAVSEDPNVVGTLTQALKDPAVMYPALYGLIHLDTDLSRQAALYFLQNNDQRKTEAAQSILDKAERVSRVAAKFHRVFDQFPLCAMLVLMQVATDAEYLEFLAWRNAQTKPLSTVVTIEHIREDRLIQQYLINGQEDMIMVGAADNVNDGLMLILQLRPDIVILNHEAPGTVTGLEVVGRIHRMTPAATLILRAPDLSITAHAQGAGATGVLHAVPLHPDSRFVTDIRRYIIAV